MWFFLLCDWLCYLHSRRRACDARKKKRYIVAFSTVLRKFAWLFLTHGPTAVRLAALVGGKIDFSFIYSKMLRWRKGNVSSDVKTSHRGVDSLSLTQRLCAFSRSLNTVRRRCVNREKNWGRENSNFHTQLFVFGLCTFFSLLSFLCKYLDCPHSSLVEFSV